MPMKMQEYPDNWKWLSAQVRKRNGGRCELCNAPNGEIVLRPKKQYALDWEQPWYSQDNNMPPEYEECFTRTKIILTVHHIDGDKSNNSEQNLISLCQRDHLRLDIAKHMRNRKRSRQLAREGK
jgi:hypothetical protein